MQRLIKLHEDLETGNDYLNLKDILRNTNIKENDVYYYQIDPKGKSLVLTLYGKNKEQLKVKEK